MRHNILRRTLVGIAATTVILPALAVLGTTTASATPGVGVGVTNLAAANVGRTACGPNSIGGAGFETSCTGNSGQPENWGADFVAWDWATEGINITGLLTTNGGATPATFAKYGGPNGSIHSSPLYVPQLGDAVVYDNPADYVAIVTSVNADGSIQTTDGDWGGQGPGASNVQNVTLPSGQTAVGSAPDPMNGKTISAYVSPMPSANVGTSLTPFGATTWTPPGSGTRRTDVLAEDPHGVLWDYSHTVGSTDPLGNATQAEANWGHYRSVGVADWNHDGFPDILAIDTNTNVMQAFTGSANGFAQTAIQIGVGWSLDYRIMGIADWSHDGHLGIVAVTLSNGDEWFYPGDLTGGVAAQIEIGGGFNNKYWGAVGAGDITNDGYNGLLTCRSDTNALLFYPGDLAGGTGGGAGHGNWGNGLDVWDGCNNYTFFGVTDYTGDGHLDVLARDNTTGNLVVNPGTGAIGNATSVGTVIMAGDSSTKTSTPMGAIAWTPPGASTPRVDVYLLGTAGVLTDVQEGADGKLDSSTQLATGWTHYRPVGVADWNHDGYPDVIVIDTSNNTEQVFPGSVTGLSATPTQVGVGWSLDYRIMGIADWTHDGHLGQVVVTSSNGTEWFYPGDLAGGVAPQIQIGGGFTPQYNAVGVADITGDGHYDLLICRTDVNMLLLFAGDRTGGSAYGYGTTRMTGCAGDTPVGLVDYNGDGHPDLITRDNATGNLILATGAGAGWWQDNSTATVATNW
jgi:hypothetical protein